MSNNTKTWLLALLAAGIGGMSSSLLSALAMPDAFNTSHIGLVHIGKAALIGAAVPVLTLLKQSPIPTQSTSTTLTVTEEKKST